MPKHANQALSLLEKAADDMCGTLSIAHQPWKGKKKFDGVLKILGEKFFPKFPENFCSGQKPTFISNLYIIFIIFFIIVRIKSGKVGKKPANPHKYWVFRGQNAKNFWPFAHFFWPFSAFLSDFQKQPKKCPKKWAENGHKFRPLKKFREKVPSKKGHFFNFRKAVFFAENHKIGYVRTLFTASDQF